MQFFPNGPILLVKLSNEIIKEILQHPVKITLAFFTLVYFFHEIRLRRKLLEQELEVKQEQLLAEQIEREARSKWLADQVGLVSDLSNELSKSISDELNKNNNWAYEGLEKAKLGLHSKTLFGMRKGDFSDEKEFLAKSFSPFLLDRIERFVNDGCDVFLIIESGSTVYPFFKHFGRAATFQFAKGKRWTKDHLTLITKNIPGIELLTETGRIFPDNRYSDIAVKCMILPGTPVPVFSGILGRDTSEWISKTVVENRAHA